MNPSRIARTLGIQELARLLYSAERARTPVSPFTESQPDLGVAEAYAIQEAYAALRTADGARLVGRKIGATSKPIQELFGIDTPDFGHIFDDMVVDDGGVITREELIQPMVEPELAFLLHRGLEGPTVSRTDVLAATDAVVPCLEIIDSRIDDWRIGFADTVADNGSSARCVFGPHRVPLDGLDLAAVSAEMHHNGRSVGDATGAAVLGHPADAVAWLANALAEFDRALRPGEYVLSGSFMTAVRAERGDAFEARFAGIGDVSCRFV